MVIESFSIFGDSFTWGEGLELYLNTPKWISQRNEKSEWQELSIIQDTLSIGFREFNRYPNIVSRHYNTTLFIDPNNGGSIQSLIRNLFSLVESNIENSILIIQFSSFTRNLIHTDRIFDSSLDCPCEFCMSPGIYKESINFFNIYDILHYGHRYQKKLVLLKEYIEKTHFIDFNNKFEAFNKLQKLEIEYYKKHIDFLVNKFVIPLEKRNIKTYFIDSWEKETSDVLKQNQYINSNLIPLIGQDGNTYTNYIDWENTFQYLRIKDEFPNTKNSHPTLIQHKHIANSIINYLNNFVF